MLLRIDPAAPEALADQIAAQVRGSIARGEVGPGDRLPSARELAGSLGVNMHTVLRAYAELRDEGVIELRRGRGAVVTAAGSPGQVELAELARTFVERGRRLGLDQDQLVDLVRRAAR